MSGDGGGRPVIPFVDLAREYRQLRAEIDGALDRVLESGHFVLNTEVEAFEEEFAGALGCASAVGVNSGTDALTIALDAVGVGTCVLAGNSRGGEIAWRYALAHPDRLAGLVLVDAAGYPSDGGPLAYWLARLPGVRVAARWVTPRALVRSSLRSAYGDPDRVDPGTVRRYHDLLRRPGVRDAHLEMLRTDFRDDRTDELPGVSVPTLVVWGERDEWIDPENARRFLRDLPDARLVTYSDLGHVPMEEAPARTAADVREFLREIGDDRTDPG